MNCDRSVAGVSHRRTARASAEAAGVGRRVSGADRISDASTGDDVGPSVCGSANTGIAGGEWRAAIAIAGLDCGRGGAYRRAGGGAYFFARGGVAAFGPIGGL